MINFSESTVKSGSWILTASGRHIDLLAPCPDEIMIEDIALGLSRECRFSGQTREFYSVAQHSVLVSLIVPEEFALPALPNQTNSYRSRPYRARSVRTKPSQPCHIVFTDTRTAFPVAPGLRADSFPGLCFPPFGGILCFSGSSRTKGIPDTAG